MTTAFKIIGDTKGKFDELVQRPIIKKLFWLVGASVTSQFIRLATNIVLTRLLFPSVFGIMLLVNSLRTGIELLTDVGIGQNIVRHKLGNDQEFINTAWTTQIIRGVILSLIGLAISYPVSLIYGKPYLTAIVAVASLTFLINGFISPGRFTYQKNGRVKELAVFEVIIAIMSMAVHLVLVWFYPSLWGLITALLVSAFLGSVMSFALMPWSALRMAIHWPYLKDMIHFGKWLLLSSFIFFLAMNFDRLYLAGVISLTTLGVYGVARSLSEALTALAGRAGSLLIFPRIAEAANANREIRPEIVPLRTICLLVAGVALGGIISLSDVAVRILYDERYIAAAFILPILLAGVWFTILSTVGEAILMGISRPSWTAAGNGAKLVWICVGVPFTIAFYSFFAALLVIVSAEFVRYVVMSAAKVRMQLSFFGSDLLLTLAMIGSAIAFRCLFYVVGIAPSLDVWWSYGAGLR